MKLGHSENEPPKKKSDGLSKERRSPLNTVKGATSL